MRIPLLVDRETHADDTCGANQAEPQPFSAQHKGGHEMKGSDIQMLSLSLSENGFRYVSNYRDVAHCSFPFNSRGAEVAPRWPASSWWKLWRPRPVRLAS